MLEDEWYPRMLDSYEAKVWSGGGLDGSNSVASPQRRTAILVTHDHDDHDNDSPLSMRSCLSGIGHFDMCGKHHKPRPRNELYFRGGGHLPC